ncbi:MAG: Nramp family divalent metal transporter [Planctomycetales bacterium]
MSQAPPPPFDPYVVTDQGVAPPPRTLATAFRKIGPGIILAGSIVGSGELILTTSLGARFGFQFLWLILFSCIIKVFIQIELGRFTLSSGETTLVALDKLGGPRLGGNWQLWWFFLMLLGTTVQLGAMLGGVALALHAAFPHSPEFFAWLGGFISPQLADWAMQRPEHPWAVLTALTAVVLLVSGGYQRIELITTILVAAVTAITVACVVAVPYLGYPITMSDIYQGFVIDPKLYSKAAVLAAFSCFGITGVGAVELYVYPYWCVEKGYARFTGPNHPGNEWADRARGWVRVLQLDSWFSMLIYTTATVAFYMLGATVLYRQGLNPQGTAIITTLSEMYVPVFGSWTRVFFLLGCWAVLFKTVYVASAANSRITADFLNVSKFVRFRDYNDRKRCVRIWCAIYPTIGLLLYLLVREPQGMVIMGGFIQAATLPLISFSTVYLRYKRTDKRIAPGLVSDVLMWFAAVSISAVAIYAVQDSFLHKILPMLEGSTKPAAIEKVEGDKAAGEKKVESGK